MFAAERAARALRAFGAMLGGVAGWALLAPIAGLLPRRRDWVAVIGREDGKFLDNTKYFFIEAAKNSAQVLRVVQVTERKDTIAWVRQGGLEALHFPSMKALYFLLRCGTVVVDSIEWTRRGRHFLLSGARRVQLWHGVGFKRIELDKWRNEAPSRSWMAIPGIQALRWLRKRFNGRIITYDAVVTTSVFYRDQVFRRALLALSYPILGYPRNSFGRIEQAQDLVWANVDISRVQIENWRVRGRRILLVAPTFRDTRATPMGLDDITVKQLDSFCETHGIELLFKFHPYERGVTNIRGSHLHILKADSDVYPLFPALDAMVTDYSSIYMDFLLLNRPIFFLVPDLDEYLARDRSIQFDFKDMTPGPKVQSWASLMEALLDDPSEWTTMRDRLRQQAFNEATDKNATARLMEFMQDRSWIVQRPTLGRQSKPT